MRVQFAQKLLQLAKKDKKIFFLTGDLGYNAFEELRGKLGKRFINAGVAEHNMVTAAAGLAYAGFKPWIYSIAPFVTIKVLEEVRNDICLSKANVKIVGLGGGYDYGLAGPTHHALQDVAIMLTLPSMNVYAPCFVEDMDAIVEHIYKRKGPAYLRLTKGVLESQTPPSYRPIRKLLSGDKITMVVFGSIVKKAIQACQSLAKKNLVDLWGVSELPLGLSREIVASIRKTKALCIIEEHVSSGALAHHMSHTLVSKGIPVKRFVHLYAKGYISKKYGDQDFYLKESGLDAQSIIKVIEQFSV